MRSATTRRASSPGRQPALQTPAEWTSRPSSLSLKPSQRIRQLVLKDILDTIWVIRTAFYPSCRLDFIRRTMTTSSEPAFDPSLIDCPFPVYAQLREHAPVVEMAPDVFMITRYEDVAKV